MTTVSSRDVAKIGTLNTYISIQEILFSHDVVTYHRGENVFFAVFSAPAARNAILILFLVSTFSMKKFCPSTLFV